MIFKQLRLGELQRHRKDSLFEQLMVCFSHFSVVRQLWRTDLSGHDSLKTWDNTQNHSLLRIERPFIENSLGRIHKIRILPMTTFQTPSARLTSEFIRAMSFGTNL